MRKPVRLSYESGIVFVGIDVLGVYKVSVPSGVSCRVEPSEETRFAFVYYSCRLYTVHNH